MESYLPYSSATPPGCILITTGHPSPLIIAGVRCLAPGTGVSSRCVCPSVCYVKLSAPRYSTTWLGSIYKYGMFYPRETPVICRDLIAVIMHIYFPPWRRFCISRPKQGLPFFSPYVINWRPWYGFSDSLHSFHRLTFSLHFLLFWYNAKIYITKMTTIP